jgi:hypothetical protein
MLAGPARSGPAPVTRSGWSRLGLVDPEALSPGGQPRLVRAAPALSGPNPTQAAGAFQPHGAHSAHGRVRSRRYRPWRTNTGAATIGPGTRADGPGAGEYSGTEYPGPDYPAPEDYSGSRAHVTWGRDPADEPGEGDW